MALIILLIGKAKEEAPPMLQNINPNPLPGSFQFAIQRLIAEQSVWKKIGCPFQAFCIEQHSCDSRKHKPTRHYSSHTDQDGKELLCLLFWVGGRVCALMCCSRVTKEEESVKGPFKGKAFSSFQSPFTRRRETLRADGGSAYIVERCT